MMCDVRSKRGNLTLTITLTITFSSNRIARMREKEKRKQITSFTLASYMSIDVISQLVDMLVFSF